MVRGDDRDRGNGLRDRRRRLFTDDAGITLLEIMVATAVMSVVMTIFTAGMVQIYRSTERTEAGIDAQAQLAVVFGRLDREVRYATEINPPGSAVVGGRSYWYVEYVTEPSTGEWRCFQLRVPAAQAGVSVANTRLEARSWPLDAPAGPGGFSTVASSVRPPSTNPFSQPSARQLRVRLGTSATAGPGDAPAEAATDVTFTALNSVGGSDNAAACAQQRTVTA